MSDKKNWGSTVMGWFIVQDQTAGSASSSADDYSSSQGTPIDADLGGDNSASSAAASQPPLNVFTTKPPDAPGGNVDFDAVFGAAGIDAEERERITRTLDLLNSLPAGTDEVVKKQIVMASLKAFGVAIEKIIESGAEELQALEAYIRAGASDTESVVTQGEQRIKQLETEIGNIRTVMQQRVEEQNSVIKSCNVKKLEVQKVLEFFGQEAVAKVVKESPKLQEPGPA